ncbi:Similar to Fam210b: Protein FAM210B [Cotesia congregata]|uniref:Mitochondrial (Mus musculus) n=1 Tax=Cotesia congregata TaxID=51543 RepID=A0A8J2MTL5_COTCN|nr:Similar to Fam210b: Protein FAM210B [Cotesia congregata]
MALSRIRCSREFPSIFNHFNYPVTMQSKKLIEMHVNISKKVNFHVSRVRNYPEAPQIPLPRNVSEIFGNETGRFTPERARDITAPVLSLINGPNGACDRLNSSRWAGLRCIDSHVASYDCFGAVSLNSSMQTMVPKPFCAAGKSTYLNMPGGQWTRDSKYIAEYMQKAHYAVLKNKNPNLSKSTLSSTIAHYSTDSKQTDPSKDLSASSSSDEKLTNAQKLKRAVKDYGSTVIVFHVTISLMSLGIFYLIVYSGLDIQAFVKMLPTSSSERLENVMTNSSTFLIAYAIHKLFAPVRISITLGATPFIVKYLRKIGILSKKVTKT